MKEQQRYILYLNDRTARVKQWSSKYQVWNIHGMGYIERDSTYGWVWKDTNVMLEWATREPYPWSRQIALLIRDELRYRRLV